MERPYNTVKAVGGRDQTIIDLIGEIQSEEVNIIELIDRRKRLNSIWPWLLFSFNWPCWRT